MKEEVEIWKDIPGYEGLYQVSNLGRVKSVNRGGEIKPKTHNTGYVHITLSKAGAKKTMLLHRVVASAFISNPYRKTQVNHINGIKSDNSAFNLEWATPKENTRHQFDVLGGKRLSGADHYKSKKVKATNLVTGKVQEFDSMATAGKTLKIAVGSICNCCQGHKQTAGGYKWEYA